MSPRQYKRREFQPRELSDDLSAAERKLADYLARRDHSERELKTKLSRRFTTETVNQVVERAKERGWLAPPEKLSQQVANSLNRRGKGIRYIQNKLRQKGLPTVASDRDLEVEKARELVLKRWNWPKPWTKEQQGKIGRFLYSRGFDENTIRTVLYERS